MSHAVATALEIGQLSGPSFAVDIRGHRVVVDQPAQSGGADAGPTPTELFVASLAACTAHYAYSYLHHHGLPDHGIGVRCRFTWSSDSPPRVSSVDLEMTLPEGIPEVRVAAVLRAAGRCAVHASIDHGVEVSLHL